MAGKTDCFPRGQQNLVRRPFHHAAAYVGPLPAVRIAFGAALFLACIGVTQAASTPKPASRTSNEVWIAARADAVVGTGSQDNPYDGSTQARFDASMMAIPSNSAIHLGPGTFLTKGIIPKSGWRLYLTPNTILRLDVLASIPGQKWAIFGAGSPTSVGNVRIEGGIWDCNLQNQKIPLAAEAIAFAGGGGNITIRNIKVVNWGSTFRDAECFVVGVFNVGSTGMIARNVILDGIEITEPAPLNHLSSASLIGAHGQDPANAKALSNGWLEKVEIKNCYVHDIDIPVMTASVQMGSWCKDVHIHHNRFENLGPKSNTLFGCYLDTGASEDVVVEKNLFLGVTHGIWASMSTPDPVGEWIIRNNHILINRNYASGGIELRGVNTTIQNVLIERNTIASATRQSLTAYGIVLANAVDATIRDNIIDDINGRNHIVFEKGVANAHLFNNQKRDHTRVHLGSQGEVRTP
jgi:hypothetical protein